MNDRKVSRLAYLLATIIYVVGVHVVMAMFDDKNLLMGTAGNFVAAIVALCLEKAQARWNASIAYMVPAILVPLFVSSALKGIYGGAVFAMLCAIIISGFMLPVARLIIPIFATLAQRKIISN